MWNFDTGDEIATYSGSISSIESIFLSKDEKVLYAISSDNIIRLWNIQSGNEILKMIIFDNKEWAFISSKGYYNTSENGEKYLKVFDGQDLISIENFHEYNNIEILKSLIK
jgi:WD40 repeat protein